MVTSYIKCIVIFDDFGWLKCIVISDDFGWLKCIVISDDFGWLKCIVISDGFGWLKCIVISDDFGWLKCIVISDGFGWLKCIVTSDYFVCLIFQRNYSVYYSHLHLTLQNNLGKLAASAVMLGRNALSIHQDDMRIEATLKKLLHCKALKEEES